MIWKDIQITSRQARHRVILSENLKELESFKQKVIDYKSLQQLQALLLVKDEVKALALIFLYG